MIIAARRCLATFFDRLHDSPKKEWLDTCVVSLAAVGFLGHLLLVAVVVIIFTVFGALTHFMPEENQMKRTGSNR